MSTAIAIDPAEAISAAVVEVYDRLRELVDRGPTDDPNLLDQISKLVSAARRKVNRARKAAEPAPQPAEPKAAEPKAAEPTPTAAPTAATIGAESRVTEPPAKPSVADRPLAASIPAAGRLTVPITEPAPAAAPASAAPDARPTVAAAADLTPAGRHRLRRPRMPWWIHALIAVLAAGVAVGAIVFGGPWGLAGAALGGPAFLAARRLRAHRRRSSR